MVDCVNRGGSAGPRPACHGFRYEKVTKFPTAPLFCFLGSEEIIERWNRAGSDPGNLTCRRNVTSKPDFPLNPLLSLSSLKNTNTFVFYFSLWHRLQRPAVELEKDKCTYFPPEIFYNLSHSLVGDLTWQSYIIPASSCPFPTNQPGRTRTAHRPMLETMKGKMATGKMSQNIALFLLRGCLLIFSTSYFPNRCFKLDFQQCNIAIVLILNVLDALLGVERERPKNISVKI